jgi:hypothetical protein
MPKRFFFLHSIQTNSGAYSPKALSLWVKQLGNEVNHSAVSRDKVKNAWSYTAQPSAS